MDGKHFYSTSPENANQKVLVGIRAHSVDILTDGGQVITTHKRVFGDNRSDVSDYTTTLAVLMKNSGAYRRKQHLCNIVLHSQGSFSRLLYMESK